MFAITNIRKRVVVGVVLAAGVAVAGGTTYLATRPATAEITPAAGNALDPPAQTDVLIYVSGAVMHPGLYRLSPDARASDAIAAAGGLTSDANLGKLPDLAARVHDGRQINVPIGKSSSGTATKLDVNSATVDELAAVPGMPPGLAQAIVDFRTQWGPFTTMTELRDALGVDKSTATDLGHYLRAVVPS